MNANIISKIEILKYRIQFQHEFYDEYKAKQLDPAYNPELIQYCLDNCTKNIESFKSEIRKLEYLENVTIDQLLIDIQAFYG